MLPSANTAAHPKWDNDQQLIIEAEPADRLIVEAGPGMGKTAVACARIAWLVDHGLRPERVFVVSFTRTAVKEIHDRITYFLAKPEQGSAVRIATIDSTTWTIRQGYSDGAAAVPFGSYEESISEVLEKIRSKVDGVLEFLESIDHLVIDEAQDIVGVRADLLAAIIDNVRSQCGVTIFCDSAQAIYGFSDDESSVPLIKRLDSQFDTLVLKSIYRTDQPNLKSLFSRGRDVLLTETSPGPDKLKAVREIILSDKTAEANDLEESLESCDPNTLVLYRRRVEVLTLASKLRAKGVASSIRLSGHSRGAFPWLGALFGRCTEKALAKPEFDGLWETEFNCQSLPEISRDGAWDLLSSIVRGPGGTINLSRLRSLLSRGRPPLELTDQDSSGETVVISTVHASKGREAEVVLFMMPDYSGEVERAEEEARVMFVGATRARGRLHIGRAPFVRSRPLDDEDGRERRTLPGTPRAQVEVGRDGDVDHASVISRDLNGNPETCEKLQRRLFELRHGSCGAMALNTPGVPDWHYVVIDGGAPPLRLCFMSGLFMKDMWHVANIIGQQAGRRFRPAERIPYLHLIGAASVALEPDDPLLSTCYEPYRSSGIFLVPKLFGYTVFYPAIMRGRRL